MPSEVLQKQDNEARAQYPVDCEVRRIEGGDWGKVVGYVEKERWGYNDMYERTTPVIQVQHYFGLAKDYPIEEIEAWTNHPSSSFGRFFCGLGLHRLEKEPSRRDVVKNTGIDVAFFTSGIQKAIKVCTRDGCAEQRKVWREGWCGVGGIGTRWRKLSSQKESYINSLQGI